MPIFTIKRALQAAAVLGCLAGAVVSAQQARLGAARSTNVALALKLAPGDPQALAAMIDWRLGTQRKTYGKTAQLRDSQRVLAGQPLLPRGLRQYGLALSGSKADQRAAPFLALASKMTRRDLATQIALASYQLQQRDYSGAVAALDAVFSTNTDARAMIFPLLVKAGSLPELDRAVAGQSDRGSKWVSSYLYFLGGINGGSASVARVLFAVRQPAKLSDAAGIARETISQRAVAGKPEEARQLFAHATGNGMLAQSSDYFGNPAAITAARGMPWQLYGWPEAASEWHRTEGRNTALDIVADPGARRTIARQLRFDPAGVMLWRVQFDPMEFPGGAQISLSLACGSSAPQLVWTARADGTPAEPVSQLMRARIPADCPAQVYTLDVVGPAGSEGLAVSMVLAAQRAKEGAS